ncbi:hypothetical protein [Okeania sp. SIO3I5]|nr:hypothetical protein [Okeania sp. SIO3I5]
MLYPIGWGSVGTVRSGAKGKSRNNIYKPTNNCQKQTLNLRNY